MPSGLKSFMDDAVMERALPWAHGWAPNGLRVTLFGGEPTLNWPLIQRWVPRWRSYFGTRGTPITFTMTTNGTKLLPAVREFMDEYRIGMLLSLDGPQRIHDKVRVNRAGRPSWDIIKPEGVLAWRPNLDVAWTLDPSMDFEPDDINWFADHGFKSIEFNINWMTTWSEPDQLRLMRFFKRAGRLMAQGKLNSYWGSKVQQCLASRERMAVPCGTGLAMLGLTPEGWLYPSQEMCFTVFESDKAPGTAEYYRVGDVSKSPVIDAERLAIVSQIRTEQIKPQPPYDCQDCIGRGACLGGCHCRYVGQNPTDPSYRYDTPAGYCASFRAAITGLLQAQVIEGKLQPAATPTMVAPRSGEPRPLVNSNDATTLSVDPERGGMAAFSKRFLPFAKETAA
jgi:uncharacterized protein